MCHVIWSFNWIQPFNNLFKTLLRTVKGLRWFFFSLLACHSIIQADRIHKTPGPETKDLSISFPLVSLVPRIPQGQRRWMLDHRQLASQSRNSELQELESFIKGSKQNYWRETLFSSCLTGSKTALYSRWRFYHYLPRLFTIQTSLKIQSGEEG